MQIRWRLRMAAAQREVWTGAQLRRLLAERAGLEMSAASVSALLTKQPTQVKMQTLIALCTALECTPDDLFEVDTTPITRAKPPARRAEPKAAPGARSTGLSPESNQHAARVPPLCHLWSIDAPGAGPLLFVSSSASRGGRQTSLPRLRQAATPARGRGYVRPVCPPV